MGGSGMRRGLNRTLLALCGLAAAAAGGAIVLDGPARRGFRPAGWWPGPDSVLPRSTDAATHAMAGVGGPAVAVTAVLLLAWLACQAGPRERRQLPLPSASVDGAPAPRLRTRALTTAVSERAATTDGVRRVRTRLDGRPVRPRARLTVLLEPDADPSAVLAGLCGTPDGPLAEARRSTGRERLTADLRLRVAPAGDHRVR